MRCSIPAQAETVAAKAAWEVATVETASAVEVATAVVARAGVTAAVAMAREYLAVAAAAVGVEVDWEPGVGLAATEVVVVEVLAAAAAGQERAVQLLARCTATEVGAAREAMPTTWTA